MRPLAALPAVLLLVACGDPLPEDWGPGYYCGHGDDEKRPPGTPEPDASGADPCPVGLDFEGRCDGDVAVWCDAGRLRRRYCVPCGETCRWVDRTWGYYCAGSQSR
jgi:hypothetical protein